MSRTVEIRFYKEVLYHTVESETNCERTTSKEKVSKRKSTTTIPMKLFLCNNDFFYNVLCVLVFIATAAIIATEVYYNGITKCYPMAVASVILTIVFISVLQYVRIDNNKKKK